MVKVIDKRPTNPQDSLRRLLDGIKTPASVPHGIKVAGPNDYVSFMDSAGVSHRWDGDAIATFDERMGAAEQKMAEAEEQLAEARAELDAAKERIGAASGDLTTYIEKVDAAQAAADAAKETLNGLEAELAAASSEIDGVKARLSTSETKAEELASDVVALEAGLADATWAAQEAKQAAALAQTSANGKNAVTYSTGTPSGAGGRPGDTHYQVNASGTVLRWWRWSGTAWAPQALDGQVVSSLDAGKITAGTLDAARIRARSITGDKIDAQSVAAAVGTFVKVNAENITVTSELAARIVNVMDLTAKKLVVSEEALLANATFLGVTIAEELNFTKLLRGRDAIIDGTLDVAQLNVTGAMAAEIVNAMDLNAKKLVVNEEAIMNQLTVIQNIVTPELVAERINVKNLGAALVTAGALQTEEAPNRGVKITSAGINAWDLAGRQTIRLNGADNLLVGSLATGDTTTGRIRIFNGPHPVNGRPYGFITMHDVGGESGKQGVIEFNEQALTLSVKDGTSNGHTQPFRRGLLVSPDGATLVGNLLLDGQFKKSPAFRAHAIMFGHIPAGHYKEARQPFTKVNGQRPYNVTQLSSSNFANVNAVTWTHDTEVVIRVYNNSAFEARDVWADMILLGLER